MAGSGRAELVDHESPEPGPGEVRLDVLAAGVCHSDLAVLAGGVSRAWALPFTLGHEICGRVAVLGSDVEGVDVGDQVVVHAPYGCGRCRRCERGQTNYCDDRDRLPAAGIGLGVDGGMADSVVVGAERLVSASGVDPVVAATLTDAGLTSFHAIEGCRDLLTEPDAVVVVIGVGGLGHLAIGILRACYGVQVVAVDTRDAALELAGECGADVAVGPGGAAAAVTAVAGGRGADVVFDFAGAQSSLELATAVLRTAGELVVVGSGGGVLRVAKPGVLPAGIRLRLPFWGSRTELSGVVELARQGALRPRTTTFPLTEADRAFAELRDGKLVGRAVLVPR
ncbi:alcohol dehydrogenase catalytic domain-containing protein [Prauserella sp. ASG 168]|uniref:alcohol dehydrogenase n=2 Tax=Prauserella cavernicola TaxID=2800127 RepID=A0A934V3L6_9PSEU|nr:alcohol dehydrogenase catalytic domain-containing protein [Prauserella cavernicola]